ncbi:MAG: phage major capsid protein [Clostridium sp.]|nr:phage major capsid protein [Clostridium sp.]
MMNIVDIQQKANDFMEAVKSGNAEKMAQSSQLLFEAIAQKLIDDNANNNANSVIMAQRGDRVLTTEETKFYKNWAKAAASDNPKQAFTDLITKDGMPETIIEDVYKNLQQNHPLLSKVDFRDVKYLTKMIVNKHTKDLAVWGKITEEYKKKLESSFDVFYIEQATLSAFLVLPKEMLKLGPNWLDNYVRTILYEAIACGAVYGIVDGKGAEGEPIGMTRDVSEGVSHSDKDGYPRKTPIKVTNFDVKNYLELVAKLSKDEQGNDKIFEKVTLITKLQDYLLKIAPATTVRGLDGEYKNNLFPFPTEYVPVAAGLNDGEALLVLPDEYKFLIGAGKNGVITYSDDVKYIEKERVYGIDFHAAGRFVDNNSAILLDISELDPSYITIAVPASDNSNTPKV